MVVWTGATTAAASACWESTTTGDVDVLLRGSDEVEVDAVAVADALGSPVALPVVWFASSARAVALPDGSLDDGWLAKGEAEGSDSGSGSVDDTWWTLVGR